jgi:hypothetical protein
VVVAGGDDDVALADDEEMVCGRLLWRRKGFAGEKCIGPDVETGEVAGGAF